MSHSVHTDRHVRCEEAGLSSEAAAFAILITLINPYCLVLKARGPVAGHVETLMNDKIINKDNQFSNRLCGPQLPLSTDYANTAREIGPGRTVMPRLSEPIACFGTRTITATMSVLNAAQNDNTAFSEIPIMFARSLYTKIVLIDLYL